ncbi:hypothetical protein [Enterovibrio calviensis]|uniref:hypothetical protein n=1 Tax=Enterovibrio calviensis TaxID=91359 RepID=UPI0037357E4B
MPAIRYQHNDKSVVLHDAKPHGGSSLIPAYLKDGSLVYYPFGGFVSRDALKYEQTVQLTDIHDFSAAADEGNAFSESWRDVSSQTLLGAFIKGKYFVVLNNGKPITASRHKR